jgi:hypothetical protein
MITSSGGLSVEAVVGLSIVSLICMSGLLASDRSTERRLRPVHEGGRDGLQIEFKPVERKITSRHGVDSRPLSERLRHAWGPAARVRRSFHEDRSSGTLGRGEEGLHASMTMEDYRTGGTPWFVAIHQDGVALEDGFVIDADRFTRALGESDPAAP